MENNEVKKSKRGFGGMSETQRRAIARMGGLAAHAKGTAHEFSSDEARTAGRKGGMSISQNRVHMSEIGRKGGNARAKNYAAKRSTLGGDITGGVTIAVTDGELSATPNGAPAPIKLSVVDGEGY